MLLAHTHLGTWPSIQVCVLAGNQKGYLSVRRPALNALSHTSQGSSHFVAHTNCCLFCWLTSASPTPGQCVFSYTIVRRLRVSAGPIPPSEEQEPTQICLSSWACACGFQLVLAVRQLTSICPSYLPCELQAPMSDAKTVILQRLLSQLQRLCKVKSL